MSYDVDIPLSPAWSVEQDRYEEIDGALITHVECHLPQDGGADDEAFMDIYVGDMPSDTTAEDEAYANYADIVGWDEEDDEDNPIAEWSFKHKKAYGFSGECENGAIMLLMCVEILKGALLIATVIAKDDDAVGKWAKYLEEKLSVKAVK